MSTTEITNFPKKGDNLKVHINNSNYEQFDYEFATEIKEQYPDVWKMGKGNKSFRLWSDARGGVENDDVKDFLVKRERWIEKNKSTEDLKTMISCMKRGGVCEKGEVYMKEKIKGSIKKQAGDMSKKTKQTNKADDQKSKVIKTFEFKATKEGLRVIATKEIVDRDGEIIKVDGIDRTSYMKNPVLLWGHRMYGDVYDVVGKTEDWKVEYDDNGVKMLTFKPIFANHQKAQDLKDMVEQGFINTVSIGFSYDWEYYDDMNMAVEKSELYEVSFVPVPANPEALTLMKSKGLLSEEDEKFLKMQKMHPVYKAKVKEFRKFFMSDELCNLIGYKKLGKEVADMKNIYDILIQSLTDKSANQKSHADGQENPDQTLKVEEAFSVFEKVIGKYEKS